MTYFQINLNIVEFAITRVNIDMGDDSDSDTEMMSLLAKHGDKPSGSTIMPTVVAAKLAAPVVATNHESDSDSEMMALAAKHGGNLGAQKAKEKVAPTVSS